MGVGVVEGTFLLGGLLLVLQTYFEFERDKEGRWSFRIKKKPTREALLKPLVKKTTGLVGVVIIWVKWAIWRRPWRWQGL
jgi:hypothetical protein